MSHDHLFLGSALMIEPMLPRHAASPRQARNAADAERRAFERLHVRQRRIETPTLRMALPTTLPGHVY